jgi:mannose-6-phosphate isomerase-like protein (cupin superfamily)
MSGPQASSSRSGWGLIHIRGVQTGGRFSLVELTAPPGDMPPLHVHRRDDETFYVLGGELTLHVGDRVVRAGPGTCVHAPRDVPHTYQVTSTEPARWLVVSSPAGFEELVEQMGRRPNKELLADYGIDVLGPPGTMPTR